MIVVCTKLLHTCRFLPARRYASAVLPVVVCPSVRLPVPGQCFMQTAGRIALVFWHTVLLRLTLYAYCVLRKFGYIQNKGNFLLRLCLNSQPLHFKNFATARPVLSTLNRRRFITLTVQLSRAIGLKEPRTSTVIKCCQQQTDDRRLFIALGD